MTALDPADIFRQEASELFETLEGALLDLGLRPDDRDLVDSAFRALHTIKGSGAMFGFDQVAAFTHEFETAFDLVRKGEIRPTHDLISVALAAKDYIRALIETPESTDPIIGAAILDDLKQFMDTGSGRRLVVATGVMFQAAVEFVVPLRIVVQHHASGGRVDGHLLDARYDAEGLLDLFEQIGVVLRRRDLHANAARNLVRDLQFHLCRHCRSCCSKRSRGPNRSLRQSSVALHMLDDAATSIDPAFVQPVAAHAGLVVVATGVQAAGRALPRGSFVAKPSFSACTSATMSFTCSWASANISLDFCANL